MEDTRNLGYKVIDVKKLNEDNPDYVNIWKNNTGEATHFTYSSFDRYEKQSSISHKVNSGFKLDLGFLKIGNKRSVESTLKKAFSDEKTSAYGQLDIIIRDSIYRMEYDSNIKQEIRRKYLSKNFIKDLYALHPSEVFYKYGGFVLADFVVGGKATAIYGGETQKERTSEFRESNLHNEIGVSFKFKPKKDTISGELSLGRGRGNDNSSSFKSEFSTMLMSVKTIGGDSSFATFSVPQEVKGADINLSSWLNSLDDKETHSVVEIGDNGLIPLSDLIPEANIRRQTQTYYKNGVTNYHKLQEPEIRLRFSIIHPAEKIVVGTFLKTRFGDNILLRIKGFPVSSYSSGKDVDDYVEAEAERIYKILKVRVIKPSISTRATKVTDPLPDNELFMEPDLCKFEHDGTIYIIDSRNHDLSGVVRSLSIHNAKTISDYGLQELLNRLPRIEVDYEELMSDDHIIYAL